MNLFHNVPKGIGPEGSSYEETTVGADFDGALQVSVCASVLPLVRIISNDRRFEHLQQRQCESTAFGFVVELFPRRRFMVGRDMPAAST